MLFVYLAQVRRSMHRFLHIYTRLCSDGERLRVRRVGVSPALAWCVVVLLWCRWWWCEAAFLSYLYYPSTPYPQDHPGEGHRYTPPKIFFNKKGALFLHDFDYDSATIRSRHLSSFWIQREEKERNSKKTGSNRWGSKAEGHFTFTPPVA